MQEPNEDYFDDIQADMEPLRPGGAGGDMEHTAVYDVPCCIYDIRHAAAWTAAPYPLKQRVTIVSNANQRIRDRIRERTYPELAKVHADAAPPVRDMLVAFEARMAKRVAADYQDCERRVAYMLDMYTAIGQTPTALYTALDEAHIATDRAHTVIDRMEALRDDLATECLRMTAVIQTPVMTEAQLRAGVPQTKVARQMLEAMTTYTFTSAEDRREIWQPPADWAAHTTMVFVRLPVKITGTFANNGPSIIVSMGHIQVLSTAVASSTNLVTTLALANAPAEPLVMHVRGLRAGEDLVVQLTDAADIMALIP